METIAASGLWMYCGIAPTAVHVVALDYDFWYAIGKAADGLAPGETPQIDAGGLLYYVRQRPGWPNGEKPFWADSQGFPTLAEAIAAAESAIPDPVTWQ